MIYEILCAWNNFILRMGQYVLTKIINYEVDMFNYILKKIHFSKMKNKSTNSDRVSNSGNTTNDSASTLSKDLSKNIKNIKVAVGNSTDVIVREFSFGQKKDINAALIFIDGLVNTAVINESIIESLMYRSDILNLQRELENGNINTIKKEILSVSEVKNANTLETVTDGFLSGDAVLIIDGINKALIISCKGWEQRGISEPTTESVIRGPKEGFTENLRTNTSLLRRKIKSTSLIMETIILGKKTKTNVCLTYIKGVANEELIQEIKRRLEDINTDSILESGYIEQYIEDAPFSIFSTIAYTEKPDVVAAKLLEGRAAIMVDGTPFVLTAPMFFIESFQTSEDYYSRPYFMSMLRLIRFIAFFITTLAPAFYVALTTFHQELIPTDLLFTMAAAREGIPFPAVVEAGIMLLAFEVLREAGVRLPRAVGQAISIVGALVMGESAVAAGIIGAPMVIVIAITAVAIFAVPNQADAAAILRMIFLILAGVMGGFGITVGLLATLIHLASLKSFGCHYLSPIVPLKPKDTKDSIIRAPLWTMGKRPNGLAKNDKTRQARFIQATLKPNENDREG